MDDDFVGQHTYKHCILIENIRDSEYQLLRIRFIFTISSIPTRNLTQNSVPHFWPCINLYNLILFFAKQPNKDMVLERVHPRKLTWNLKMMVFP